MVLKRIKKAVLFTRLFGYVLRLYVSFLGRTVSVRLAGLTTRTSSPPVDPSEVKNIVVVGAAFAGYFAARTLAWSLPRDGRYRVVVIEPNSHFNFTWVLPRFCVVEGHEHKAFIPYTPDFFAKGPKGMVRWIRDRVVSVRRESVVLRSGEEVPYEYLIIATGSTVADGLPSRVGVEDKEGGVELLRAMQARIKGADHVVVAGGGAAGVELATDAKNQYPDKCITLVHSRGAVMHRFGPGLQKAAMDALQTLGVDVILNEKADPTSADGKFITLSSGRKIECDCFKPASGLITELAPEAISPSGHIRVKPTLQIDADFPNIYVCGDVADTKAPNPNSRIAARQAEIAADNVVLAVRGKKPRYTYKTQWGDGVIKLTLGLVSTCTLMGWRLLTESLHERSVTQFWDGEEELLFHGKETDLALMCDGAWTSVAAKPFEDTGVYSG
ncbi:FAD/NAD(P)-binding domain-containing protein [Canariomyces notabilis]|uniref:FAD/NAD(P)-binding domain-containing protein n=1 Tax=Canariomyces notabilis TaxID=2074819 RepID=A0AAN6QIS3_9PEZI|nr:FAD/NAD(P)-binding domain-containing protein [Canariomyces arenarius]